MVALVAGTGQAETQAAQAGITTQNAGPGHGPRLSWVDGLFLPRGDAVMASDPPHPGRSENDADAMLTALLPLQRLTAAGPAVLVQHHPRKRASPDGQSARGSGALSGYVDVLLEMHWYEQAADNDRRRRLLAWSRYDETPRQLVIELNAAGTDYACLGDFEEEAARPLRPPLWQILAGARTRLTRKQVLEQWPPDQPKVDPASVWRLLEGAVASGDLKREGTGLKNDPFRYWL